ncbi:family 10 glycosylhydrolase [Candidatus Sumerlaeota bacterium]|nr:family 10 glycosylhydrolase [Candidatus Sumerlaeota bacterium]
MKTIIQGDLTIRLIYITALVMIVLFIFFGAQAEEIRALWVTRWDYKTTDAVRAIIDNAADYHFNYLLFQVRGNGTVFYESSIEPWAWELTGSDPSTLGQDPGWNPLAFATQYAHSKGLKLVAYMNTYPGWRGTIPPPPDVHQLWNDHPDWFCVDSSGTTMTLNSGYVFLSPGIPGVQQYLRDVYLEVISNYDVDGIHFDYVRYPGRNYSWDGPSLQRFYDQYGGTPETMPDEWSQFRRDQVTALVSRVSQDGVAVKPEVLFTAATWASYYSGYNYYFQDSWGWLAEGILDVSHPMIYTPSVSTFTNMATQHVEHRADRFVAPGIGAYTMSDVAPFLAEVESSRQLGAHGLTVFAYSSLFPGHTPNEKAQALLAGPFKFTDVIPPALWKINPSDDDNTGPRIFNFRTDKPPTAHSSVYIQCDITDPSGVYDDDTSSSGQGVYLRWAINASPLSSTNEVKMHLLANNTFITDEPILIPAQGDVLYYQVIAYDNDFDDSNPEDRARRVSAIMSITPQPEPIYYFDRLFGRPLSAPQYCVVDQQGKVWVCDYSADQIVVFNPDGTETAFSPITQGLDENGYPVAVDCPSGIAVDPEGNVWVSLDDNYDAPLFYGLLKFRSTDGSALNGMTLSFRPGDLDFDDAGNMFIVEKVNDRWHVLTRTSDYATSYSFGPGTTNHTNRALAVTNDGSTVYIASSTDGAVHRWTGSVSGGVASYSQTTDLTTVSGTSGAVEVDNQGWVFVSDAGADAVKVFDSEGTLLQTIVNSSPPLSNPRGVGFTSDSIYIYIVQFASNSQLQRWTQYNRTAFWLFY